MIVNEPKITHFQLTHRRSNRICKVYRISNIGTSRDEDPDPVIFGQSDPDPVLFSTDPDPTCNNGFIKLFLS